MRTRTSEEMYLSCLSGIGFSDLLDLKLILVVFFFLGGRQSLVLGEIVVPGVRGLVKEPLTRKENWFT